MADLIYEPIPRLSRSEINNAIGNGNPDEVSIAVLSAALYGDDHSFAQDVCVRLSQHPHFNVRGNAILGFAHIARIDRKLDETLIKPIIIAALADEHEFVRGHADAAKEDTEIYLNWNYSN